MGSRFEKFSERARRVLSLAQEEAQRFNHNYIGPEHILLGLVRETEGVAARVLSSLSVDLSKVRSAVEFIIGRGEKPAQGEIGLTPRAKKVVELAVDEARRMNHTYIGTEHLLIGLLREGEGVAAGVLESLGVNLDKVRGETSRILTQTVHQTQGGGGSSRKTSRTPTLDQLGIDLSREAKTASGGERRRAAIALFAERGYENLNMRTLAGWVGLKAPTLYNYYASKEQLLIEAIELGMTDFFSYILEGIDEVPREERLFEIVRRHAGYKMRHRLIALEGQRQHFQGGTTNVTFCHRLAGIYLDTLGTFRFRIRVQGEPARLQDEDNAARIRALFLAGVRAAFLWHQLGGRRWRLLFQRKQQLEILESIKFSEL